MSESLDSVEQLTADDEEQELPGVWRDEDLLWAMLDMLKTDLGITSVNTHYDDRFKQLLRAAMKAIAAEGVATLSMSDPLDQELIVMYAAWLWRKRDFTLGTRKNVDMTVMPRMLRLALNNRKFSETAGGDPA